MIRRRWLLERAEQAKARARLPDPATGERALLVEDLIAERERAAPREPQSETTVMGPDGKLRVVNLRRLEGVKAAELAAELLATEPAPTGYEPQAAAEEPIALPPGVVVPAQG